VQAFAVLAAGGLVAGRRFRGRQALIQDPRGLVQLDSQGPFQADVASPGGVLNKIID
jgi:hypothetical protein